MIKKKKYKMISIIPSYECSKKPRCSFCYLKQEKIISALLGNKEKFKGIWNSTHPYQQDLIKNTEQVAIAYNGTDILGLKRIVEDIRLITREKVIINLTINPRSLNLNLVALFKYNLKIDGMITLSLDSEKLDLKNLNSIACENGLEKWIKANGNLRQFKFKVGANILMLDSMFSKLPIILKNIAPITDQIHLLRPKFYESKIPLEKRKQMIFLLKQQYKRKLFIDQCFRFEFQGIQCTRGKDFLSINPDNTVSLCSFDLYREGKKNLKKCPYIN